VNPAHVRTLQEIARHQSFSRAAQALHLSQPAVSHHIRHLEHELGQPLLERVGKRAFPTRAGEVLLAHAARAFAELEAARQSLHGLRGVVAGRLRVGTGATASTYLLPPLLRRLHAAHPELELVIVTGNSAGIAAAVAGNDLDVAVVTLPVHGRAMTVTPLMLDPLVAIAPADRRWRTRSPLTPGNLARHPLILYERGGTIRRVIDQWFRRAHATPHVAMDLGNGEAIKRLVAAGLGLSVVPAMSVRAEVRARELVALPLAPPLGRRLGVVRRRDRAPNAALRAFLEGLDALVSAKPRRPPPATPA
jgi:DNA-binding transcriptional LysR family regulator